MGDEAVILRRLWNRESFSYDGPAGRFPTLSWDANGADFPDFPPPPLLLAAIGPKTLALGGTHFDAVLLHPFLTPDAVARSRDIVRDAASRAGRDPDAVRVIHQLVIAPDMDQAGVDEAVHKRAAAYFAHPGFGEPILAANGWSVDRVGPFRAAAAAAVEDNRANGSPLKGRDVYLAPSRLLPPEIVDEGAAIGTAASCAARLHDYFDAGADEIVVHGATGDLLGTTVAAFEAH
jgi:probable F420-dependent oxidoreductase